MHMPSLFTSACRRSHTRLRSCDSAYPDNKEAVARYRFDSFPRKQRRCLSGKRPRNLRRKARRWSYFLR